MLAVQLQLEQQEKDAALRQAQLTEDSLAAEKARVYLASPTQRLLITMLSRPVSAMLQTSYVLNAHIANCIGARVARVFDMINL